MKMTVDKLLKIVYTAKGKLKKNSYVMCYADVRSEGSDMNAICVGATFGKNGIRFLISDDDNVADYIDQFESVVTDSKLFNKVFIDKEPYLMTNYQFVDALFKYENYLKQNKINPNTLNVDVEAVLAGGFECSFEKFEISGDAFEVNVVCEDFS